jgi:carbon-monoxide dehydrogenase large subunit
MHGETVAAHVGSSVLRREDERLLRGQGEYLADIVLPGMVHVAFVRSPMAHARIEGIDLRAAAALPGVVMALDGAELARLMPPVKDQQLPLPAKWRTTVSHRIVDPRQPLLAIDRVRHVGEAVAVIVAVDRYVAEDAVDLVELALEPLPAVVDPEQAMAEGMPRVHEQAPRNLFAEFSVGKGDALAALERAPRRLKRRFRHHRYAGMPMECRGVLGQYERRTGHLTVWSSTQVVHWVRRELAHTLSLPEARIRCVAPDVGGGFGTKGHVYPEDLLIPFLAMKLGRPVRWIEDRREHLQSACHSRDQIHDIAVGFDDTGRILAVHDRFIMDCGAWNPVGVGIPYNTASHLIGPYKVDNLRVEAFVVATNKVPNAPYRGAGRPEAAHAMERMMDLVARELGLEPAEVRRRNMVRADEMPYAVGIPYRDGEPIVYDTGDYPRALDKALAELGGLQAFRERQAAARLRGKHLGLGLCVYTEGTGVGPFEGATVRIDPSGRIYVAAGSCPQGQGMETIFAQVAADCWKVSPDDVVLTFADTAAIPMGFGTIASRSTVTLSAAIHEASERVRRKVFAIAANALECAERDLELRDGRVGVVGVPGASMTLAQVAAAARPGWDHRRPANTEAGLESTYYWEPPTVTWSYAAHAVIVEVDVELGRVRLDRYVIAHDCGVLVNPMLAEGQIVGGAVQGIGGAMLEEFLYDEQGQLLAGSFMEYLLPSAGDLPRITVLHEQSPSPSNPLGVKGLGEGGAIGPPVAIANAVSDALAPWAAEFNDTPVTPQRIFEATRRRPPSA